MNLEQCRFSISINKIGLFTLLAHIENKTNNLDIYLIKQIKDSPWFKILAAFIIMYIQGINANIMSLSGIAIAIGVMVDAAIVLIENVHKHFEKTKVTDENRWEIIEKAALEVGPPLFFSLFFFSFDYNLKLSSCFCSASSRRTSICPFSIH